MLKATITFAMLSLLATACASSNASSPGTRGSGDVRPLPTNTVVPQASRTPSPTLTPAPPAEAPFAREGTDPTPTPTFFSEVLDSELPAPATREPEPVIVRGGTTLPLPEGTSVVWGGCSSDGQCNWFNFYWGPTREVVMQNGEREIKVQHELCHAHQHWSINGGAPLDPSDYDLESWYETVEGTSFLAAVGGLPWPWSHSAINGLEDFAWTCAYWYLQPSDLLAMSPERYAWAVANLP